MSTPCEFESCSSTVTGGSDCAQEIATKLETSAAAALLRPLLFTIDLDPHCPKELGGRQRGLRTSASAHPPRGRNIEFEFQCRSLKTFAPNFARSARSQLENRVRIRTRFFGVDPCRAAAPNVSVVPSSEKRARLLFLNDSIPWAANRSALVRIRTPF